MDVWYVYVFIMRNREQWRLVVEESKAHPGLQRRTEGRKEGRKEGMY
jgi:hypothetical protein